MALIIFTFIFVWWIVLFMVLPWGIQREDNLEQGHEAGAPKNPRLKLKLLVTTGISVLIVGLLVFLDFQQTWGLFL
jgi:predicted secreted protein